MPQRPVGQADGGIGKDHPPVPQRPQVRWRHDTREPTPPLLILLIYRPINNMINGGDPGARHPLIGKCDANSTCLATWPGPSLRAAKLASGLLDGQV
jgi:hypothetical protein